jgi:hypothetical protein
MPLVPAFGALGRRAALVLGLAAGGGVAAAPAHADTLGPLTPMSAGRSPFASCTADKPAQQAGTVHPNSEVEPWVDADPRNARNLVAGWQQDRWSNSGARGLAVGYSRDGGRTWKTTIPPKLSQCSGGKFQRATDPWVSFAADGTVHLMSLSTDEDRPDGGNGRHAMLATRSTDGGRSWGDPITLIEDDDPQVLNDKNALTADPTNPSFAYAVWHRLRDFRLPEAAKGGGALGAWRRARFLRSLAAEAAPVYFEGPTWLARTTNGGRSWEAARPIFDPGRNAQTFANQVVVPPDGRVMVFFTEVTPGGVSRLAVLSSFDKGRTFARRPTYIATMSYSDSGTITPDEGAPVRDGAMLFDVAVDRKSSALHVVWQDTRFRGIDQVAFARSINGGRTWSRPVRVDKTPASANRLREQAFLPSVVVGAGGEVVATYYDFRHDDGAAERTDHWAVRCRRACQKAASWGDELRLTARSFDMLEAPVARGHFLGDYMGLVAAGRTVHAVFAIADGPGRTSLFTRTITLGD